MTKLFLHEHMSFTGHVPRRSGRTVPKTCEKYQTSWRTVPFFPQPRYGIAPVCELSAVWNWLRVYVVLFEGTIPNLIGKVSIGVGGAGTIMSRTTPACRTWDTA